MLALAEAGWCSDLRQAASPFIGFVLARTNASGFDRRSILLSALSQLHRRPPPLGVSVPFIAVQCHQLTQILRVVTVTVNAADAVCAPIRATSLRIKVLFLEQRRDGTARFQPHAGIRAVLLRSPRHRNAVNN
jgi:hypothetical protein